MVEKIAVHRAVIIASGIAFLVVGFLAVRFVPRVFGLDEKTVLYVAYAVGIAGLIFLFLYGIKARAQ